MSIVCALFTKNSYNTNVGDFKFVIAKSSPLLSQLIVETQLKSIN